MNIRVEIPQHATVDIMAASKMWANGKSASEIGKKFGVTRNVVIGITSRHRGLFPNKNVEKDYDPKLLSTASKLWSEGLSLRAIGHKVGRTQPTISRLSRKFPELFPQREPVVRERPEPKPQRSLEQHKPERRFTYEQPAPADLDWVQPVDGKQYDADRLQFGKTLIDLERGECHWPLNAGGPFLFCADETNGSDYCAHHAYRSRARGRSNEGK